MFVPPVPVVVEVVEPAIFTELVVGVGGVEFVVASPAVSEPNAGTAEGFLPFGVSLFAVEGLSAAFA